jgi:hypothetical protein
MPDLIYNVKFEIDQASAEKVGQIVDTSNAQDIKVLQKEVERLSQTLKENAVENGKVKKSVKEKILAYKEEVASLKLLDTKINKSIQVYGEFSNETKELVNDLRMQSEVVDSSGQELLDYAETTDRTTAEIVALTNAVSTGNRAMVSGEKRAREMTRAQQMMGGQLGTTNKTFAAGNQAVFSFSDLIQDSTQFSYGFASGMRAIGNNIGFTAELLAVVSAQAKQAGVSLRTSLLSSLRGVNGVVLGLNVAVTLFTIGLQSIQKRSRDAKEEVQSFSNTVSDLTENILSLNNINDLNTRSLLSSISAQNQLATRFEEYVNLLKSRGFNELAETYSKQAEELRKQADIESDRRQELIRILQVQSGLTEQTIKNRLANIDLNESRIESLEIQEKSLELFLRQDGAAGILGGTLDRLLEVQRGIVRVERANLRSKLDTGLITQREFDLQTQILDQRLLQLKIEEDIAKARAEQEIFGETEADRVFDEFQATMKRRVTAVDPSGFLPDLDFTIDVPALDIIGEEELLKSQAKEQQDAINQVMKDGVEQRVKLQNDEVNAKKELLKLDEKNNSNSLKAIAQTAASVIPSLFEDQKASAIASALVNAGSAIVRQYADLPLAAAIPASIATAAATKKQIDEIKKTKFGDRGNVSAGGGGGSTSAISPISSASGASQPTQSISFLPNAATSGQAPPTVDVKIDRAGLAVAVNKGNRELANKQVRV